jgi:hypothetical protein
MVRLPARTFAVNLNPSQSTAQHSSIMLWYATDVVEYRKTKPRFACDEHLHKGLPSRVKTADGDARPSRTDRGEVQLTVSRRWIGATIRANATAKITQAANA